MTRRTWGQPRKRLAALVHRVRSRSTGAGSALLRRRPAGYHQYAGYLGALRRTREAAQPVRTSRIVEPSSRGTKRSGWGTWRTITTGGGAARGLQDTGDRGQRHGQSGGEGGDPRAAACHRQRRVAGDRSEQMAHRDAAGLGEREGALWTRAALAASGGISGGRRLCRRAPRPAARSRRRVNDLQALRSDPPGRALRGVRRHHRGRPLPVAATQPWRSRQRMQLSSTWFP